jgi:splicing factor 3B subunit 3
MFLYNFSLQKTSAIINTVYGNFSSPKAQEVVISRGKSIELLRPDENGKLQTIVCTEMFAVIRSLLAFRLTGMHLLIAHHSSLSGAAKDHLVVGSDSGRIVILSYNAESNAWVKVHEETFGRTGCRRIVPGQYLTGDPRGMHWLRVKHFI